MNNTPKEFIKGKIPQPIKEKKPFQYNGLPGEIALGGLMAYDILTPQQKDKRKYLRPEDLPSYNEHPYGTGSQAIAKKGATLKGKAKYSKKDSFPIPPNQPSMVMPIGGTIPGLTGSFYGRVPASEEMKKGGWIAGAVNPEHKGYCTPMTKSTCTGHRKAFAKRAKAHFKEDGGVVEYPDGGVIPLPKIAPILSPSLNVQWDGGVPTINLNKQLGKKTALNLNATPSQQGAQFGVGVVRSFDQGGGLSRAEDYGSKKKPYPSVASGSFAGGGRSYPIPTHADAIDALRLAGLHGREDVKAKVYKKYPDLKKAMGGQMTYENGGGLQTHAGGQTELRSYNPFDGGTFQFNGQSHDQGGIDISFQGKPAEVEGQETANIDQQGNLKIMGNMYIPGTKMKYKTMSKKLSDKENKAQGFIDKGLTLIQTANPEDPFERLSFNSGAAMMKGGMKKQEELASLKQHLGDMQQAHLEMVQPMKTNVGKYGTAIYAAKGATIDPTKPWNYGKANVKNMDPKILDFLTRLQNKGISGDVGSGYRPGAITKSGHKSRHGANQALDIMPSLGNQSYQTILKDPELVKYLMDNNLTMINEYDPNVSKLTQSGTPTPHLHIGRDQGTNLANQFRKDATTLYPDMFKGQNVKTDYPAPQLTSLPGDNYNNNVAPGWAPPPFTPIDIKTNSPFVPKTVQGTQDNYDFVNPKPHPKPSNARGLNPTQLLGEGYAIATNQQEPVKAQLYNPDLYQPYQVSFQDRLNENTAQLKGIEKQIGDNPTALSTLAGQQYEANSSVLGDEFRTNQQIANDITNKNVSLLNEAKHTNLGILDQQYVRQAQAKSNTKSINQDALNSISSKLLQKEASNNALRVYENLYPDYAFNKNTGQANYYGPDAGERIQGMIDNAGNIIGGGTANGADRSQVSTKVGNTTTTNYYDNPLDTYIKQQKVLSEKLNPPALQGVNLQKYYSTYNKKRK